MITKLLATLLMLTFVSPALAQEVALKIGPPLEAIHVGDYPTFIVTISNQGKKPLTLVEPGDGSDCKWRTPVVGWSVLPSGGIENHPKEPPLFHGGRCGNINTLKLKEIFTLKPGESKKIGEWVRCPTFANLGKFRVVFYYQNIHNLKVSGLPLGEHEDGVIEKIQQSYPCQLISNEIIVEVFPKKK